MTAMQYENSLCDPGELDLHARSVEAVTWHGRRALWLDELALVPDLRVADARIDVLVGADGPCYPGIAFRAADAINYELAFGFSDELSLYLGDEQVFVARTSSRDSQGV